MKKLCIFAFAILLVAVFTLPAAALENEFGGYWRTRFFTQKDFSGSDATGYDEANDMSRVDTRTRLYYTATLNDNLKLVNKFEMDAVWGDNNEPSYGDIGTDGVVVEVKNSYADATFGMANLKLGAQGAALSRGFIFDDDFAGAVLNFNLDTVQIPLIWIRVDEGYTTGSGKDANDGDADIYAVAPTFGVGGVSINPVLVWATTQDISKTTDMAGLLGGTGYKKANAYFLGVNADATFGMANAWFTGIYEGGTIEGTGGNEDLDISAFLVGLGGGADFGMFNVRGQVFYATGDDDSTDTDVNAFTGAPGQSYYWSEIMGYGTFDNQVSNGSPANKISDILAVGIGGSVSPMEKLELALDIWYAQYAENELNGADVDDDLGTEVDFSVDYALMEDLNLRVVAAYLFAGEATDPTADNDNTVNPFELGAQISLSF